MSTWLQQHTSSHHGQLLATAIVSGLVVAGTIWASQTIRHNVARDELRASIPNVDEEHDSQAVPEYDLASLQSQVDAREDERTASLARRAQHGDYDDELINEQLTRTSSFLTPSGLSRLRASFVIIVGMGGVGSHCTAALARSGLSHIRVIDFDQVTLSSLNRHALATLSDVGTPKVTCVRKRLEAVSPWIHWECFSEAWDEAKAPRLLQGWDEGRGREPDYIVDAIDNIDSKVALLKYCHDRGIKVISSMGAGCKADPTRVFVGDISASIEDPLSRCTRRRLKMLGINEGIPVIYSTEKPGPGKATLLPLLETEFQKGKVGELGVLPDYRARILPVLGTMPAIFGYVAANYVIMEISGYPHEVGGGKLRDKMYENIGQNLQVLEERLAKASGQMSLGLKVPITRDDVGYLIEEVFHGKSVVSNLATRLALVRWRYPENGYKIETHGDEQKSSKLLLQDLVCMTKEEAVIHEQRVLLEGARPEDLYDPAVLLLVKQRRCEEEAYNMHR